MAIALVFGLAGAACVLTAECDEQGNVPCPEGKVCVRGFCRVICETDQDCAEEEYCFVRPNNDNYCVNPNEPCLIECAEHEICRRGECIPLNPDVVEETVEE